MAELRRCTREALDGAGRLRNIVRDLQMGPPAAEDDVDVELHPLLLSCIKVARTEVNHRARVVTEFDAVPTVRGSETRLGRLFSNLIRNAAEAVAGDSAQEHFIRVSTRTDPSRCVVVDIADSGPGVPAEIGNRIFDPFFTTKPARGNSGLGLAICRQIAGDLGGSVELEPPPGRGALFRVTLPSRRAPRAGAAGSGTGRFASSRPPVRRLASRPA
jgi:signal transduction histidine kinase